MSQIKQWYVLVSAILLITVVVGILNHRVEIHHAQDPIVNTIIDLQNPINVKEINVLKGDEFSLLLGDNRRIHAILDVRSIPDSKEKLLRFLNDCTNPRVILKGENNGVWQVEMFVTTQSSSGEVEISVSKWLRDKKLVYD